MPLERFKLTPPYPRETRVIGTHLFPVRLFGVGGGVGGAGLRSGDEDEATKIIRTLTVEGDEIFVSRMGGMFIRPPGSLSDYGDDVEPTPLEEKLRFENKAVSIFNLLICELALEGVVAEPVSTLDLGRGQLLEGHALIGLQNLAPDPYRERTAAPYRELVKEPDWWLRWWSTPEAALHRADGVGRALRLAEIMPSLPATIAGAHYCFSRRLFGEASAHGWLVLELIGERSEADLELDAVREAKRHREEVARGGEVTPEAATAAINGMTAAIERACGASVAAPEMPRRRLVW